MTGLLVSGEKDPHGFKMALFKPKAEPHAKHDVDANARESE